MGVDLVFQVRVAVQISVEGTDKLHYPRPAILSPSIRIDALTNTKLPEITGFNTEGDVVIFDVNNLGGDSAQIEVRYGPAGQPKTQLCVGAKIVSYLGQSAVQCTTSPGKGRGFRFEVWAGNQRSSEGAVIYNYVTSPEITRVAGCTNSGNATINCATQGGTIITVSQTDGLGLNIALR